jgi:hypothetical protein
VSNRNNDLLTGIFPGGLCYTQPLILPHDPESYVPQPNSPIADASNLTLIGKVIQLALSSEDPYALIPRTTVQDFRMYQLYVTLERNLCNRSNHFCSVTIV